MSKFILNKLLYKYFFIFSLDKRPSLIGSLFKVKLAKSKYLSEFYGIILKKKTVNLSYTLTLRNVVKKSALERGFNLNSNAIIQLEFIKIGLSRYVNRCNLFFLRELGLGLSFFK